jgi:FtsP/CotA-like multicopper oxidase with cupredoxin domain
MNWKLSALAGMLLSTALLANAAEVAGVKIDDTAVADGTPLVLNGAGLRSRVFIKVYVAALYLPQKSTQASTITQVNGPRRVVLRMMRGLDAQTLTAALEDGVRNNSSPAELAAVKPAMDELLAQMLKLSKLNEADVVVIDMTPQLTRVSVNGRPAAQVAGASLPGALLRVWLGESPVETSLKTALLGG